MDAGLLDVLGDGVRHKRAVARDGVNVDFLGAFDELCDHDGVLGRDVGGAREVVGELRGGKGDIHGGAREDVGGADEDGVADVGGKGGGRGGVSELLPRGLINANPVKNLRKLESVLGHVNRHGARAQHVDSPL